MNAVGRVKRFTARFRAGSRVRPRPQRSVQRFGVHFRDPLCARRSFCRGLTRHRTATCSPRDAAVNCGLLDPLDGYICFCSAAISSFGFDLHSRVCVQKPRGRSSMANEADDGGKSWTSRGLCFTGTWCLVARCHQSPPALSREESYRCAHHMVARWASDPETSTHAMTRAGSCFARETRSSRSACIMHPRCLGHHWHLGWFWHPLPSAE